MAEWSPQAVERGELSEAKLHLAPDQTPAVPGMALVRENHRAHVDVIHNFRTG